jgi:hypothetical protein
MGSQAQTRSEELVTRAWRLARECGECEISFAILELCQEYEQAIADALRLEATIHDLTKH